MDFAQSLWRETYAGSVAKRGRMDAALSGGRTPTRLYRSLARTTGATEWKNIHIFLVDERFVSLTDKDSNYRMIWENMLSAAPIIGNNVHSVPMGGRDPVEAAEAYEAELRSHFGLKTGEFPRFDLVMLGLGEDGHTASLFPGNPSSHETERLASPVVLDAARHNRITLTLPVINNSRCIIFLVLGAGKARALKATVEGKDMAFPASHVEPREGHLFFLADRGAAGLLSPETYETAATRRGVYKT